MNRNIKIILIILFIVILMNCSNEPNYDTYLIFQSQREFIYMPVWYSTGESIVFGYGDDLASINPNGADFKILLYGYNYFKPPIAGILSHSVSDDGYVLFDTLHFVNDNIYYFKPGSDPVKFSFEGSSGTVYGNLSGRYNIAYLYDDNEETDDWSIYISDINGSKPKKLIGEGYFYSPDWSSDGRKIVYINEEKRLLQSLPLQY
ncbi:MAG: hypothetical protein ACUVWP_01160 [bacterium]